MEITDLRYFSVVGVEQNLHQAAKKLHLSPSALSKAMARLEGELERPLFTRRLRRLQLTEEGRQLLRYASLLLTLEEEARQNITGSKVNVQVRVAGPEACLLRIAPGLRRTLSRRLGRFSLFLDPTSEVEAIRQVRAGEVHLAVTCGASPTGMKNRILAKSHFRTYVGKGHPLAGRRSVSVGEVLEYPFAVTELPLFGEVGRTEHFDGWRDDKFPRMIGFRSASLRLLEEAVVAGEAVAYLPDFYGDALPLVPLSVTGCPYVCEQTLRIVAHRPDEVQWLKLIFSELVD